jgi:hypothetical protein
LAVTDCCCFSSTNCNLTRTKAKATPGPLDVSSLQLKVILRRRFTAWTVPLSLKSRSTDSQLIYIKVPLRKRTIDQMTIWCLFQVSIRLFSLYCIECLDTYIEY